MSTQDAQQLTLFQEDSPASHFPWLESKKVKKTIVTSGRKCSELSENLRRVGLSVRTYLASCELPGEQFVRTWSVRDTLSPYLILKLRLSERRTDEKECSLWRTPEAGDSANRTFAVNSRTVKLYPTPTTPRAQEYKDTLQSIPPSRMQDPVKDNLTQRMARTLLPTPQHGDYRSPNTNPGAKSRAAQLPQSEHSLPTVVGGQLNPTWVEALMGFPVGWTELEG